MKLRVLLVAVLAAPLPGCDVMFVPGYRGRPVAMVVAPPVMVAEPAPVMVVQPAPLPSPPSVAPPPTPVIVQPAPVYVEEGAVVGGVVVVAPAVIDSYVSIGGEWYYWNPGFRFWVHAHRPYGWHPRGDMRVYNGWGEHPMYRR